MKRKYIIPITVQITVSEESSMLAGSERNRHTNSKGNAWSDEEDDEASNASPVGNVGSSWTTISAHHNSLWDD